MITLITTVYHSAYLLALGERERVAIGITIGLVDSLQIKRGGGTGGKNVLISFMSRERKQTRQLLTENLVYKYNIERKIFLRS